MSRKRLLIIEDDTDVAEMLLLYFSAHEYDAARADTGKAGVALARARFPHLILLDVMLPDMDGYQVCRSIRQMSFTRYIPIIFLTQRDERTNRVKGLELGADDYVTKPFDIEELRLRVQSAIKRATRESLHEPRSGLPTGALVDDEIARRARMGVAFQRFAITLDHFKAFSDAYGFMASDEAFGYAARSIQKAVSQIGTPDDFVGVNKDRFVVLTHADNTESLISSVKQGFADGVKAFYNYQDVEQGGVLVKNGGSEDKRVPLMQLKVEAEKT